MESLLLDNIDQPSDLKNLDKEQVNKLCAEIRQFLLRNISRTGGHLASNLGAVELTVALHRVMTTPMDKIVFDVGHQCYTHKLLTGRRSGFAKLRQLDGISGFPNPNESEHDAFIAGHGNTALSLSIGMAWAKKIRHEPGWVVAVIGDGAFTGGMVYEGMNNIENLDNLLVILNDNKMSISKNVGALARYLTHLRTTTAYFDAKDNVSSFLDGIPLVGAPLKKALTEGKTLVRRAMYHSTMFEDMGFQYIGPVDGHNEEELERTLRTISQRPGPHFLHVVTKKGNGYQPAEMNPGNYHGVSAFDPDGMPDPEVAPKESFSTTFGQALAREAAQNSRICAITAAMKYGTGLQFFAHEHPERFFDVGMAEQHAVTFAAGLASQGMLPVVCIYSTFLQRSYDQILHDVNLLQENVVFAIDRAGFVPADGETHQGVYDPAFLSQVGMPLYAPSNYAELTYWLHELLKDGCRGPRAIRYPRGASKINDLPVPALEWGKAEVVRDGSDLAIWAVGREVRTALEAAGILGCSCRIVNTRFLKPFDKELFLSDAAKMPIFTIEDNLEGAGLDSIADKLLINAGHHGVHHFAWPADKIIPHGTQSCLREKFGMTPKAIACKIRMILERN